MLNGEQFHSKSNLVVICATYMTKNTQHSSQHCVLFKKSISCKSFGKDTLDFFYIHVTVEAKFEQIYLKSCATLPLIGRHAKGWTNSYYYGGLFGLIMELYSWIIIEIRKLHKNIMDLHNLIYGASWYDIQISNIQYMELNFSIYKTPR